MSNVNKPERKIIVVYLPVFGRVILTYYEADRAKHREQLVSNGIY
jgi:hypothetical protein